MLRASKSCGTDELTARMLKACGYMILAPLEYIFDLSFKTNTFPTIWKCGRVTALHKEGDPEQPTNYRPITVLPVTSKILERIVHNQSMEYHRRPDTIAIPIRIQKGALHWDMPN